MRTSTERGNLGPNVTASQVLVVFTGTGTTISIGFVLFGVAGLVILGWSLSHWMIGMAVAFGPTGILSVALAPGWIVMGDSPVDDETRENPILPARSCVPVKLK